MGKSAIVQRFVNDTFSFLHKATTGADFYCKDIAIEQNSKTVQIKLSIWDTAGQERWSQTMGAAYYRGADACILVYDINSEQSLISLHQWYADFSKYADMENTVFIVVGNKLDAY